MRRTKLICMKILFISTTYPTLERPQQGMFNKHLVESFRQRHDVRVIAPVPWPQRFSGRRPSGSNTDARNDYPTYYYPPKLLRRYYHHFYWHSIQRTLRTLASDFVPDLVIGYWLHPDTHAAQLVAQKFGVPCIAISGGSDMRVLPDNQARRRAVQRVLHRTDHLIVVSQDLRNVAIELGMDSDKISMVRRGVDSTCFRVIDRDEARAVCGLARDAVVLLWAGRLEPIKNPWMLIDAASKWKQRWGDRLKVLIVGDGSLRGEVVSRLAQAGLGDCVRMEGELSQNDLAVRYNAADLTVLTSLSEGIPNVLLESLACGTSFVATDVGGIAEIATPELDGLVTSEDPSALAACVIQKVESPSTQPRQFVPDGLTEMANRYETVFDEVMQ